jgi:hypothetical protein
VLAPRRPLQWDGGDGGTMAKKDAASKRLLAVARANARYTLNLQRAFGDLLPKLKHAYGQPAGDAAEMCAQHVVALRAIADFLSRIGPDDLAHVADQFAKLAQALQDAHDGRRVPMFTPARSRSDPTLVWLARAYVALAVETMQWCGHNRQEAAKWAAKRHPDLKQLITERGADIERSKSLERAIISWRDDFSSRKVKNHYATRVYSVGLDKLKASAPNRNSDQIEAEAGRLLEQALSRLL